MHTTASAIHYHQGQEQMARSRKHQRRQQALVLNEFRNSFCDHMSSADLYYYAWATGHSVEWLLDRAKWSDPRGMNGVFYERAIYAADLELLERVFFLP